MDDLEAAGSRALRNALLSHLSGARVEGAVEAAFEQHKKTAGTMTDRLAALSMLVRHQAERPRRMTWEARRSRRFWNGIGTTRWPSTNGFRCRRRCPVRPA